MRRAVVIVLDGCGVGYLPDADKFGDVGADTLKHVSEAVGGLSLPNLRELGLGNIHDIKGVEPVESPKAAWGKMMEVSAGKDTSTGHWELMGVLNLKPFPTFPNGFPQKLIEEFERRIGRKVLGNKPASGTVIIQELGDEHVRTGYPIVYTSADSVFQVAAHVDVIPLEELYRICEIAFELLEEFEGGKYRTARVIARPFTGTSGNYYRLNHLRKDFSVPPPKPTLLDYLKEAGYQVVSVGKIKDIFAGRGITRALKGKNNRENMELTIKLVKDEDFDGLVFVNLVDFDTLYGHRNNPKGFAEALQEFDAQLGELLNVLKDYDLLAITADHGNDPTYPGTDHTREHVPILVYSGFTKPVNLGVRKSFADLAKTLADYFQLPGDVKEKLAGESFWKLITS